MLLSRADLDHFIHKCAQLRIWLPTAICILHPTLCGDVTMRKCDLFMGEFPVVELRIWPNHAKRAAADCQNIHVDAGWSNDDKRTHVSAPFRW